MNEGRARRRRRLITLTPSNRRSAEADAGRTPIPIEVARAGATEYGFLEEIWTCERVAQVIAWEFGVRCHKGHVARILKDLDWAPQKPKVFDIRRDDEEVVSWRKEVWPELKKRRAVKTA